MKLESRVLEGNGWLVFLVKPKGTRAHGGSQPVNGETVIGMDARQEL